MKKNYAVKILSGSLSGQVFFLKEKLTIGRDFGDIVLKIPSVSEPHGEIKRPSNDCIILQDLDSKNGIIVNGERKLKTLLKEGSMFTIGKINFQLIAIQSPEEVWQEFLRKKAEKAKDQPKALKAFFRPLELHCIGGPQRGEKFFLTYGPRFFGLACVDVPLLDSKAPDRAFKLVPSKGRVVFHTDHPDICFKEGINKGNDVVNDGEIIVCGETRLKLSFK